MILQCPYVVCLMIAMNQLLLDSIFFLSVCLTFAFVVPPLHLMHFHAPVRRNSYILLRGVHASLQQSKQTNKSDHEVDDSTSTRDTGQVSAKEINSKYMWIVDFSNPNKMEQS